LKSIQTKAQSAEIAEKFALERNAKRKINQRRIKQIIQKRLENANSEPLHVSKLKAHYGKAVCEHGNE
jgi:hypothetical protein